MSNRRWMPVGAWSVLAAATIAGCAPFATYPPVEGSTAINNPSYEPVPSIIADAVRYTHNRYGDDREYAINLPANTPAKVYDKVLEKLGESTPMTSPDEWAYHVVAIRSRGLNAEADVVFPRDNAPPAMVTLHLRKNLSSYSVQSAKVWNYPVDLPAPNWVPDVRETNEAIASESPSDDGSGE